MRTALARAGRVEGGRRPTVLVVGGPLDAMVAVHWRRRVERGAGLRWRRLWAEMAARDALPPAVDLAAVAEDWTRRVPEGSVHVLLGGTTDEALRLAGDLVGASPGDADAGSRERRRHRPAPAAQPGPGHGAGRQPAPVGRRRPGRPSAPAVDRCSRDPDGSARLGGGAGRTRSRTRSAAGPWQVHGDVRRVVPSTDAGLARSVPPAETLALALEVLTSLEGGPPWPTA